MRTLFWRLTDMLCVDQKLVIYDMFMRFMYVLELLIIYLYILSWQMSVK